MSLAFAAAFACSLTVPAAGQTSEAVHAAERARFGLGDLRPGADGDPDAPGAANRDEARVGDLAAPPLFTSEAQRSPSGWPPRRAELSRLVEDHWTGRVPATVGQFRLVWRKEAVPGPSAARREHWLGQVIAPGGRMGPTADAILTFPAGPAAHPALIEYTYI